MTRRLRVGLILSCLALLTTALVVGCADARRPNEVPDPQLRINPRLAEGQRVFMKYCNQCHVGGAAGVGPSLNDKWLPAFFVRMKVRHSIGHMPTFSQRALSDADLEDILRYLKYLHEHPDGPDRA